MPASGAEILCSTSLGPEAPSSYSKIGVSALNTGSTLRQAFHPVFAYLPASPLKQRRDPAVAIVAITGWPAR
jgi:hypothetical protein